MITGLFIAWAGMIIGALLLGFCRVTVTTNRPADRRGTALQAIEWALDQTDDMLEADNFLRDWRNNNVEDWPEYLEWLKGQAS